jgi:small-conductance mechanosensitive channel
MTAAAVADARPPRADARSTLGLERGRACTSFAAGSVQVGEAPGTRGAGFVRARQVSRAGIARIVSVGRASRMRMAAALGALPAMLAAVALLAVLLPCASPLGVAHAAEARKSVTPSAEVPITVFNRTIAVLRSGFLGVQPEERARRASRQLRTLLATEAAHEVALRVEGQIAMVTVDGTLGFTLTADDLDPLHGETLAAAAEEAASVLRQVIVDMREARDPDRLLRALLAVAIATAVFLLLAWLLLRARSWLDRRLARVVRERTAAIGLPVGEALLPARAARLSARAVRLLVLALIALLAYEWLSFVLGRFPYTRPWSEQLNGFLIDTAETLGGGILGALPDLAVAVVIFAIARAVVQAASPLFARAESGRSGLSWLHADTARPTRVLFTAAVWVFALVMAYPYLPGADSEAFKGMSVLIGLMMTVGGASIIGQGASGLILMYSGTLRVGEYVRIGEREGTVVELGVFATRLRTGMGEEVTLPNALVLGTATSNFSRSVRGRGFILGTSVTIGYDTPWRLIHEMLIEAATRTPGVLASPVPQVFQTALSDFYVEYRLVCQAVPIDPRPRAEVLSALHANIQDVFAERGVQIMSPHYLGDPAAEKIPPLPEGYRSPAQAAPDGADASAERGR